jgi:hypothetical protein
VYFYSYLRFFNQRVEISLGRDDPGKPPAYDGSAFSGSANRSCAGQDITSSDKAHWHDFCSHKMKRVMCNSITLNPWRQEVIPMVRACDVTLLDVFQAVHEVAANEQETLATMVHLLTSGQVRLSDDAIRAMRDLLTTMNTAA